MSRTREIVILLLVVLWAVPAFAQRVAVAGDSWSDAYRANDNRCKGTFAAVSLNWVEHLERNNMDFGVWGSYPEPRRIDYAYNYARSGAVSADVNTKGQAAGVASQAPDVAILFVGSNDIDVARKQRAREIYYGTITAASRAAFINGIVNAHLTAMQTMQSTGAKGWMVTLFESPRPSASYQDPVGLARIAAVAQEINTRLVQGAVAGGYGMIDAEGFYVWLTARGSLQPDGTLLVAGRTITRTASCNPRSIMFPDGHPGTVFQGLWGTYIAEIVGVPVLTDEAIVAAAGL